VRLPQTSEYVATNSMIAPPIEAQQPCTGINRM
jgi:hypothetical protein